MGISSAEGRRETSNIEKKIKQTQKEMDQKRNAQAANGSPGEGAAGEEDENDMSDARLNLEEFLNTKPLKPEEMKFMRVMTSQGANTFEDIKQDLEEFRR